jgi:hypothetical protein
MNSCCKDTYREALGEVLFLIISQEITDMNRLIETLEYAILLLKKAGY